jgi:hypothetical protein
MASTSTTVKNIRPAMSIEPVAPHPGIGSNSLILLEVIERWLQIVSYCSGVDNADTGLEFV